MQFPEVLVLGATGRIGAILRQCWSGNRARWQSRSTLPGSDWLHFDPLNDPSALISAATGCGTILCLAGVTNARAAAGCDLNDNLTLARAAIRAGAEAGAQVLLTSSAAIYGASSGILDEACPPAPLSDYGRIKAVMEAEGAELGEQLGVGVTALRIGNIAGLDAILGGWHPGFALDRFADGRTPLRSYIGPEALAHVLADLCTIRNLPGTLNIAAPTPIEMGGLLDAAQLEWTARPAREGAIPHVHLSTERLARLHPPVSADPADMVAEWRRLRPQQSQHA